MLPYISALCIQLGHILSGSTGVEAYSAEKQIRCTISGQQKGLSDGPDLFYYLGCPVVLGNLIMRRSPPR